VHNRAVAQRQIGGREIVADRPGSLASEDAEDDVGGVDGMAEGFGQAALIAGSPSGEHRGEDVDLCRLPSSAPASLRRARRLPAGESVGGRRSCRRGRTSGMPGNDPPVLANHGCDRHKLWISTGRPTAFAATELLLSNRIGANSAQNLRAPDRPQFDP
jgi:hypothetical protein